MKHELSKRFLTSIVLLACLAGAYLHSTALYSFLLSAMLGIILFFEWPGLMPYKNIASIFGYLLYPVLPVFALGSLNYVFRESNMILPLYPFFIAWTADTCGYIVGKLIGRHKMCPSISPGKSWEGFAGSFLGVTIAHVILLPPLSTTPFAFINSNIFILVGFSLFITAIAFLGGFFISILKRRQNLKDAGTILPGHGGFLDRFDAVFSVSIMAWITIGIQFLLN